MTTAATDSADMPATFGDLTNKTLVRVDDGEALMVVNIGPAHPASHGTLRIMTALSGERVVAAACEIGYLHRGFEKMVEAGTYTQAIPYTDRLNYNSALMNNHAYCKAVERMLGIGIPDSRKAGDFAARPRRRRDGDQGYFGERLDAAASFQILAHG